MPTLADLLRTPGTPANTVKTTLADLFRGYNREAVAGLLGAPVDLANTVSNLTRAGIGYTGHKLGMLATPPDLIEKPALGSDWIYERLPNQPALTGSGAENTGRMLGALLSPPVVMQAAPSVARAMGRALQEKVPGMAENYLRGIGGLKDIDVWHGSPYLFNRFDSSKIGTGEGNQTYGHGLYLAETRDVGQQYRDTLAHKAFASIKQNGTNNYSVISPDGSVIAQNVLLGQAHRAKDAFDAQAGHLYRVDLPDHMLPRMLDWDAPLSGQAPQALRDAFNRLHQTYPDLKDRFFQAFREQKPGYHYYSLLSDYAKTGDLVKNQAFAAAALRNAGIPGIRYLDGGSRGAGTGTRNYVIFPGEEHNLRILERNGVPIR